MVYAFFGGMGEFDLGHAYLRSSAANILGVVADEKSQRKISRR